MVDTIRLKRTHTICLLAAAIIVLVAGAGCDFITPGEAREAVEAGRELQRIETEEIRPLQDELESLRFTEMEPRYQEIEDLHAQTRVIEQEKLEPLWRSFDGEEIKARSEALSQEIDAGFREIQELNRTIEIENRALQTRLQQDEAALEEERDAVIGSDEARRDAIQDELNDLHRYGRDAIEDMGRQAENIRRELHSLPFDSDRRPALEAQIHDLEAAMSSLEQSLRSRIDDLEENLWAVSDGLEVLYRRYEERREALHDAFSDEISLLDGRRSELDERRWALEDDASARRQALEAERRASEEDKRAAITAIEEGELLPLTARISDLEGELATLHERERTLKGQVREIRAGLEPKARELENQMLDVFESAVESAEAGQGSVGP